jgi:predicted phage terminase large subunit-like protein
MNNNLNAYLLEFLGKYPEIVKEQRQEKAYETSFYEFAKAAWPNIDSSTFQDAWHARAICEHLEAVVRGLIPKLIINVPPRTGKSALISIMFPAWVWITQPKMKFLYGSHAYSLALDHSRRCRLLIESDWYQKRWGSIFKLSADQSTKHFFTNDKHGHRLATSVGGGVTGFGANILIGDDLNDLSDGYSSTARDRANDWVSRVWSSRTNPGQFSAHIIVQQRVACSDVTGYLLDKDEKKEWVKLILPMEFETARRAKTIILPSTYPNTWEDPRKREAELLWPAGIDRLKVQTFKGDLGDYNYAGQHQQRPSPEAGGIIQKSWYQWWKQPAPPKLLQTVQSWDTALEAKDENCYSACTTWGLFEDDKKATNIILLNMWRGKVEFPVLRKMAKRLYEDYRDDGSIAIKPDNKHVPTFVLVEAKASGSSLIHELQSAGIPAYGFDPGRFGEKIQRVRLVTHMIEGGRVWVPAYPPEYVRLRNFADIFVNETSLFPKSDSRDLVDTMTQVLLRLNTSGLIKHPDAKDMEDTGTVLSDALYW